MSAFVIDTKRMDRAVLGLCYRQHGSQIVRRFMGIDTSERDAGTRIGRLLFTLNVEAVMQRYGDDDGLPGTHDAASLPRTYRAKINPMGTLVDAYKALRCLIYQCSEGDVDQSACYRELRDAAGDVSHAIITGMPEYERAKW